MNFLFIGQHVSQLAFGDLAARLRSAEFLLHAAHPDYPGAFTRQRKLPLPALVALLLSGMRKSIQSELDEFFAHLSNQAQLARLCLRASFRPGASQTVLDRHPAAQRLADRARRVLRLCAALARLALGRRRCEHGAFRPAGHPSSTPNAASC